MEFGIAPERVRLGADTRVGRVRLQVGELGRSRAWYRDALGFEARDVAPGRVDLHAAGEDAALIELHERSGAAPVPRRGRLGLFHYAILLPERAALGRLTRHLSEVGVPAGGSDHLVSEALYLQDPDGLGIEVYADRPRSAWRVRDGQLAMTTEPLDVEGLVRAGGGAPWRGMPPETVIGHVHLHVGDLERAEAFYHHGLGLDKVVWSYPGALFLSAGGYHHHVGLNTWAAGAASAGENEARLLEWELVVAGEGEAEAALSSLEAGGHAVERSDGGGVARDPWGTAVRVVAAP